jgi:hypothetical protein
MDVNRLRTGEKIVGVAAVLLFLDLFLSWYSVDVGGALARAGVNVSFSAWDIFSWVHLLLLLTILAALAMVYVRGAGRSVDLPASLPLIVAALGAFSTLIVLYRIVNQPGPNDIINVEYGAYLGLILVAGLTYGAVQAGGGVDDLRAEAESLTPRETPPAAPPPSGAASVAETVPPPQAPVPAPPPEPAAAPPPPAAAVEEPAPEPPAPEPPAPEPPAPDPEPPAPVTAPELPAFERAPEPEPPAAQPEPRPTFVGDDDEPPASEPPPPRAF